MVGSIMVVGAQTHVLLHFMCDLKTTQMNMQHSLIYFMSSKLGIIATKVTKNICYAKGDSTVEYSTVTRWFKKSVQVARPSTIKQNQAGLKPWILRP